MYSRICQRRISFRTLLKLSNGICEALQRICAGVALPQEVLAKVKAGLKLPSGTRQIVAEAGAEDAPVAQIRQIII